MSEEQVIDTTDNIELDLQNIVKKIENKQSETIASLNSKITQQSGLIARYKKMLDEFADVRQAIKQAEEQKDFSIAVDAETKRHIFAFAKRFKYSTPENFVNKVLRSLFSTSYGINALGKVIERLVDNGKAANSE